MKLPDLSQLKATRPINKIIIHCSATPENRDVKTATIKEWHLKNGWKDIGYHFVIELDGSVIVGRDINVIGSHAKGHNTGSIGICYVGGCDAKMQPKDTLNKSQQVSLAALILVLQKEYKDVKVIGHNEVSTKACPSFSVPEFMKNIYDKLWQK